MEIFKYSLSKSFLIHLYKSLKKNHSPIRLIHNYFLNNIEIKGLTIDFGSETEKNSNMSYMDHIKHDSATIKKANLLKEVDIKIDLEKKLDQKNDSYDSVILFNTLEHIENYHNLISEIHRILKINGKLEIFVPFMVGYHPDPKDIFRPTHFYLEKILSDLNFKTNIYLIGVGPFMVCFQIICKYLKFTVFKLPLFIFFYLIDRFISYFSKDFWKYYCGTHISCKKT